MKTKLEHLGVNPHERGNALVYVLIAVALFAALSFTLSRTTDTSESATLSDDQAELYALQLISYAAQARSAVDQMGFTGSDIDDLIFTFPNEAGFNTGSHIHKVYHPEGGGLNPARISKNASTSAISDLPARWYMGRFNNIEWTKTANHDVILVAYQIEKKVCEKLNVKVTGSIFIPQMNDSIKDTMIDDAHHGGANLDLSTESGTPLCADCHKVSSLCVQNQAGTAYGFYTVIADQ